MLGTVMIMTAETTAGYIAGLLDAILEEDSLRVRPRTTRRYE
jgi:hypothetical protein